MKTESSTREAITDIDSTESVALRVTPVEKHNWMMTASRIGQPVSFLIRYLMNGVASGNIEIPKAIHRPTVECEIKKR